MNFLLIETQFANDLGKYLLTKPYGEVFYLIEQLKTLQKASILPNPKEMEKEEVKKEMEKEEIKK